MNCLEGSCSKYSCDTSQIRTAVDAEVIAPFVIIGICGSNGETISVGNQSAPRFGNKAVIVSFQYGQSTGTGCTIEIIDEEGGAFQKFFNKILSAMGSAAERYELTAQWGWVGSRCDGPEGLIGRPSKVHTFIVKKVHIKFEETMKFVLECTDLMQATIDVSSSERVFGTDDNTMPLKQAIKELFRCSNPSISPENVKFLRKGKGGVVETEEWDFDKKPTASWKANQSNAIMTAREWMQGYKTDRDKGVTIAWDDTNNCNPTIIFWEDFQPRPDELTDCYNNVGTYIVNGGSCSPVLEFNPEISWNFAVASNVGGLSGSKVSAKNLKQQDEQDAQLNDEGGCEAYAGTATDIAIPDHHIRNQGKNSPKEYTLNDKKNFRANSTYESIKAQLRIQGDPQLDDPVGLKGSTVSIIVINPFHISDTSTDCPDWTPSGGSLAGSSCNEVLSNKTWFIQKLSHEIRLGSYTTTIDVFLPAPGSTINAGMPLGGSSNGYQLTE